MPLKKLLAKEGFYAHSERKATIRVKMQIMEMAGRIKEWCLDIIFPKYCFGCQTEGAFICGPCREKIRFLAPTCPICSTRNFTGVLCGSCQASSALRRFLAPFSYGDPLARELVHAYKYEGVRELKTFFADEIESFLRFYGIRPHGLSALVPIPLHRSREQRRGFNQSLLLAEELGRRLSIPVVSALCRTKATERQIDMKSYKDRRKNMADAFKMIDADAVKEKIAVLVDDVSTSGATLFEAAKVLRNGGARTVWAIVIAKA